MTQLNLKRDLVFFDIESTGLNVIRDRIVQIGMIKHFKNGNPPKELEFMVNPGIPISEESMAIHGITPDMVRNKPTFPQIAKEIFEFVKDADLAGYNSDRFDIPMLMEELYRSGYELTLNNRNLIDVQKIFYKMEPRTLKAAYQLYCNKNLEDAHDAMADVRATVEVLFGQIERYKGVDYVDGDGHITTAPIDPNIDNIAKFLSDGNALDITQKLRMSPTGEVVFNFGKYIGKNAGQTLYQDRQYYNWIQEKEFSVQVKQITTTLLKEYEAKMAAK